MGKSLNKKEIEENETGLAFTQNRLFSSSFFVSLSFDGYLQLRDVLVLFLGFCRSLATFERINCYICFHYVYVLISSLLALFLCLFTW